MGISNEIKVVTIAFVVEKLKLAISGTPAALTIFVEKPTMKGNARRNTTFAGARREVYVSITYYNYWDSLPALKGLYYENIAVLGQFCAEGFNKKIHDCLLEILSHTDDSPNLPTLLGETQHDRP